MWEVAKTKLKKQKSEVEAELKAFRDKEKALG
jgi:hypothetical protein